MFGVEGSSFEVRGFRVQDFGISRTWMRRGVGASASIRDTVRAPYNNTDGRDSAKSNRLCIHWIFPQRWLP